MTKKVEEQEFKFYFKHLDMIMDENYAIRYIDVEDNSPQQSLDLYFDVSALPDRHKECSGNHSFRFKSIKRYINGIPIIEHAYIKIS